MMCVVLALEDRSPTDDEPTAANRKGEPLVLQIHIDYYGNSKCHSFSSTFLFNH
jgi:hypothetical protein